MILRGCVNLVKLPVQWLRLASYVASFIKAISNTLETNLLGTLAQAEQDMLAGLVEHAQAEDGDDAAACTELWPSDKIACIEQVRKDVCKRVSEAKVQVCSNLLDAAALKDTCSAITNKVTCLADVDGPVFEWAVGKLGSSLKPVVEEIGKALETVKTDALGGVDKYAELVTAMAALGGTDEPPLDTLNKGRKHKAAREFGTALELADSILDEAKGFDKCFGDKLEELVFASAPPSCQMW